ncbi:hypothetical protein VHUM_02079 [Vanrija humicola]|uniref:Uncharacterized protein n=1 Tax=Vanrija humicola TaxID=5417 RepID=A0A7D8V170_VANHU|nr:hypothetical protein VHUM_02079 [Vanrija humicola]
MAGLVRGRGLASGHLAWPLRRRGRRAAPPQTLHQAQHQDVVVYPGSQPRHVPRAAGCRAGRGARDRPARLLAREPDVAVDRAAARHPQQDVGPDGRVHRQGAGGQRRAVVGGERGGHQAAAGQGDPVRPLAPAPRLAGVLCAHQRQLEEDRLRRARRDVDGARQARAGHGARRDPRQLGPGRPAAHAVHEDGGELARVCGCARHRAEVEGLVRVPVRE